jgi:hypothetical protein
MRPSRGVTCGRPVASAKRALAATAAARPSATPARAAVDSHRPAPRATAATAAGRPPQAQQVRPEARRPTAATAAARPAAQPAPQSAPASRPTAATNAARPQATPRPSLPQTRVQPAVPHTSPGRGGPSQPERQGAERYHHGEAWKSYHAAQDARRRQDWAAAQRHDSARAFHTTQGQALERARTGPARVDPGGRPHTRIQGAPQPRLPAALGGGTAHSPSVRPVARPAPQAAAPRGGSAPTRATAPAKAPAASGGAAAATRKTAADRPGARHELQRGPKGGIFYVVGGQKVYPGSSRGAMGTKRR